MNKIKNKDTTELAEYLFHQGTNFRAWEYLGVHKAGNGYTFRVWAPGAERVSLCSDFTSWDAGIPLTRVSGGGVWECFIVPDSDIEGMPYKYRVVGRGGDHLKSDPYALSFEAPPRTASIVRTEIPFDWKDQAYMAARLKHAGTPRPVNIYELHAGSWKRRDVPPPPPGTPEEEIDKGYLGWRALADELAEYVSEMGFTHIELLPVTEHPYDLSWGYQVTGFFAPTARFGKPEDFKYFMDKMHACGVGVILDWVPAHFPRDRHGLYEFDGGPLYEYQGHDRMEHKVWGTRFFDVGREEVQSFLISSALFFLEEYHVDGLRIDAAASMLYLDFDRDPGEWVPNIYGGRENLEAIAFLRKLNTEVRSRYPDVMMIAEESTAWPMVTKQPCDGGLGFSHKWNMGFANDMFDYLACDPYFRHHIHERLTFPMMYAFSENFILPVSHDEVVHGKKSLIDKMFGDYNDKFSLMRTFLSFMYAMPGKKLMFMGTEFAQFREWDCASGLEWFMLDYPRHNEMREFVIALSHIYKKSRELWECDTGWDGFSWIDADRRDDNIVSFVRYDADGRALICLFHFAPVETEYAFSVPLGGKYEVVLSTDDVSFGGSGTLPDSFTAKKAGNGGVITLTFPGNAALYLRKAAPGRRRMTLPEKKEPERASAKKPSKNPAKKAVKNTAGSAARAKKAAAKTTKEAGDV